MKAEPVQLAGGHGLGLCDLDLACTAGGASWAVTGGSDGKLIVTDAATGELVKELEVDYEVHAVAMAPDASAIAVGCDDFYVRTYKLPGLDESASVTRFTARVRGLAYSSDGAMLAACSEEPGIRVLSTDASEKIAVLEGHDGGVKSVAWDPKGEFLASLGFDGAAKVWSIDSDLDSAMCSCEHTVSACTAKEAAAPGSTCAQWGSSSDRLSWHPRGDALALPGGVAVKLLARSSWETSYITGTKEGCHMAPICASAWTNEGSHLLTACTDGKLLLWDTELKEATRAWEAAADSSGAAFTAMRWLLPSTANAFIVQDKEGRTAVIKDAVLATTTTTSSSSKTSSTAAAAAAAERAPSHGTTSSTASADASADAEADVTSDVASPALKKKTGRRFVRRAAVDSDDDSDDEATAATSTQLQESSTVDSDADASANVSSSDAPQVSRYGESLVDEEPSAPTAAATTASTGAAAATSTAGAAAAAAGYKKPASSATAAAAPAAAATAKAAAGDAEEPVVEYDDSSPLSDSETVQYQEGDQDPDVEEVQGRVTPAGQPLARRSDSIGSILSRLEGGAAGGSGVGGGGSFSRVEPVTRPQAAFQPASTPQQSRRRYLCWNGVGAVVSVDEGAHNSVEVEFADAKAGRPQRFQDTWHFTMGSLGPCGAVFANRPAPASNSNDLGFGSYGEPAAEDKSSRSVLYFMPNGRRSCGSSWTRMLPPGEPVVCCAAGDNWVAVATAKNYLRVFTSSGLQREVVRLPGPPVSIVAGGVLLGIVYHAAAPAMGSQSLGYWLLNLETGKRISEGPLGLTPTSVLTWLGFSAERMLCAMDSAGVLNGVTPVLGWGVTPLLQTKTVGGDESGGLGGARSAMWPVSISRGSLIAVALRGAEQQPVTFPRPVVTVVELAVPGVRGQEGTANDKFESSLMTVQARLKLRGAMKALQVCEERCDGGNTGTNASGYDSEDEAERERTQAAELATVDRATLKALQEAVGREATGRALDLAYRLHLEKSHLIAIKVADHHGLSALAAAIEQRMHSVFSPAVDAMDTDDYYSSSNNNTTAAAAAAYRPAAAAGQADDDTDEPGWRRALKAKSGTKKLGPLAQVREDELRRRRAAAGAEPVETEPNHYAETGSYDNDDQQQQQQQAEQSAYDEQGDAVDGTDQYEAEGQGGVADEDIEVEPEVEEEREPTPVKPKARNPFFKGTVASPPRKRKDVFTSLNDLMASPSPAKKHKPALGRTSTFAGKARSSGGSKSSGRKQ